MDALAAKYPNLPDCAWFAATIWAEARGEPIEGQVGVAWTIRNRALDGSHRWPDTIREVVLQPWQFSCWNEADPNRALLEQILEGNRPDSLAQCLYVGQGVLNGVIADNTQGANHYYALSMFKNKEVDDRYRVYTLACAYFAPAIPGNLREEVLAQLNEITKKWPPVWDDMKTPTALKGRHLFYRL